MNHNCFSPRFFVLGALLFVHLSSEAATKQSAPIPTATPVRRAAHAASTSPVRTLAPAAAGGAPSSNVRPAPMPTPVAAPNSNPYQYPAQAVPPRTPNQRHELTFAGGISFTGNNDIDRSAYQHKPFSSPLVKMGYEIALFTRHPFNLLAGIDLIYLHAEDVASGASSSAKFVSNILDGGPIIGVGWSPAGAYTPLQLQAKFGVGSQLSRDTRLESGGFSTRINNSRNSSDTGVLFPGVAAWAELLVTYQVQSHWRLSGGWMHLESTDAAIVGGSYVF